MASDPYGKPPPTRPNYRHAYRVFGVVILGLALAVVARAIATPHSPAEMDEMAAKRERARLPRHRGNGSCAGCHKKQARLTAKDAHARVKCEVCHGPGDRHSKGGKKVAAMPAPKGKRPCLTCHRMIRARPSSFAQVEWREHYKARGVTDSSIGCTTCHDPHEPLYMDRDLRSARLHPLVHRCRDCHAGSNRERTTKRPADHPKIFECSYCHPKTVEDFAKRPHHKVRCTTCHLFFRESAFAGRIIRDADPRFCLLCHGGGKFRKTGKGMAPAIAWPKHRDEMGDEKDKKKICIDCHRENLHDPALRFVGPAARAPATMPSSMPAAKGSGEQPKPKPEPEKKTKKADEDDND